MIKNVVFDLGFVLISFDWREIMTRVGITEDEMEEIATATVRSEYWGELDRGILTDEEILNGFISIAPQHKEKITKFFAAVPHNMPPYSYSNEWVASVKERGYNLYVLSNFSENNFKFCEPKYTFLDKFDGKIISYRYKCIKPEKEIYQILFDSFDLNPEECVFIDDREDNIEAAINQGMNGIVFRSYDQASSDLDKLLKEKGIHG